MSDAEFMAHIIGEICDYARKNEMEPDDTLRTVSDNIKVLLEISTFNHWKVKSNDGAGKGDQGRTTPDDAGRSVGRRSQC